MKDNYVWSITAIDGREIGVIWGGENAGIAISGLTHAHVDEWYEDISVAIYCAHYLAGKCKPGIARECVEIAQCIKAAGPAKAHVTWLNT